MTAAVAPAAIPATDARAAAIPRVASGPPVRIGVIAPTLAEGRLWRKIDQAEIATFASGADGMRARAGAERLAADGVSALISFGFAAGLAPVSRPGDVIVANSVVLPTGETIRTDEAWTQGLINRLAFTATRVMAARVAGRDRPLSAPQDKRAAFRATFAASMDTESHAVAEVATAHGLPFIVVRAITHAVEETRPQSALVGTGPGGEARRFAALACLACHPRQLATAWRLADNSRAARAALGRIAALLPLPA